MTIWSLEGRQSTDETSRQKHCDDSWLHPNKLKSSFCLSKLYITQDFHLPFFLPRLSNSSKTMKWTGIHRRFGIALPVHGSTHDRFQHDGLAAWLISTTALSTRLHPPGVRCNSHCRDPFPLTWSFRSHWRILFGYQASRDKAFPSPLLSWKTQKFARASFIRSQGWQEQSQQGNLWPYRQTRTSICETIVESKLDVVGVWRKALAVKGSNDWLRCLKRLSNNILSVLNTSLSCVSVEPHICT